MITLNYRKIYESLINRALCRNILEGYFEKHHIVPKSSGGTDNKENIVNLTGREHYIAHKLLYKINPTKENAYALVALSRMSINGIVRCNSRQVEYCRKLSAELSRSRMLINNPGKNLHGDKSLKFIGYWATPYGVFGSVYDAAKETGVSKSTIQRRCRGCDIIINSSRLGEQLAGKTWRSQGWYFIEKGEINECV